MASRIDLHEILVGILGSRNVYYDPPEDLKMEYPCIRYSKSSINVQKANNKAYLKHNRYQVMVIDRLPDNPIIDELLKLPNCSYDRHYTAGNLHHDVLTMY